MHLAIGFDPKSRNIYKDRDLNTATSFTQFDDKRQTHDC